MKLNRQEDDIASTVNGLKWLSVRNSLWDDREPLMENNNSSSSSLNFSGHSSSSQIQIQKSPIPSSSLLSSPKKKQLRMNSLRNLKLQTTAEDDKAEYEYKNAEKILIGSISAVINFLGTAGVPKPSCEQLQKNLNLGRYFAVLKRVQDYIQCIPSKTEDETLAKIHLAVSAWEALCRLKAIEYKRAYKSSFRLRYENSCCDDNGGGTMTTRSSLSSSSSLPSPISSSNSTEVKTAIALQVKIAEQSTACQKKLYLVQRWQRHLLNQMKKQSTIEPQGYKPIRCL